MNGRETVLSAVRAALSGVPGSERPDDLPRPRGRRADHAGEDVVGLFAERAAEYRATVVRVPAAGAAAAVGRALRCTGARSLVVPSGLPEGQVPDGPWSLPADVPPLTSDSSTRRTPSSPRSPRPSPSPAPWSSTTVGARDGGH
ncbi:MULTISPECIES: hypothetical protein [unclassified Streptomyces]|uniref:hypothetical protein n=1 Tax=unclassified Streptomyces TaxID=2593676 RepID=UPI002B1DA8A5|nr:MULTISPECIES: hypothetical protein [unclassified Streptomyces]